MTKTNYLFCSIVLTILFIILNCFAAYNAYGKDEYIGAADISGNEYLEKRTTVRYAGRRLSEYDYSDYNNAAKELSSEINKLEEYRAALKYQNGELDPFSIYKTIPDIDTSLSELIDDTLSWYDLTDDQAEARIEQLEYCRSRLNYAAGYSDYIGYIADNSSSLLAMPLLDKNSYAAQNAAKTKRDFYGLESVKLKAESDIGVICMFSDHMTDAFSLAYTVILAVLYTVYRKKCTYSGNVGITVSCALLCLGAALMYLCGGFIINSSVGLGDLSRPVQSVRTFLTCSSVMSVGDLALLRIVFKLLLCAAVYLVSVGMIMSPKRKTAAFITAFIAAAEIILYSMGGAFSAFSILNALTSEEIFAVYGNIDVFGNALDKRTIFGTMAAAMIIISAVFASKSLSAFGLAEREYAERAYYDKISRTYDETRRIRHDISNHLAALTVLLDNGNTAEARRYLSDISSEIGAQRLPVSTGRPVLDALLYSKSAAAEKNGISLEIEFAAAVGEKYTDFDLCGIFGNILDNAIEGSIKAAGEKTVVLTVKRQMDMLCIFCENNCVPINSRNMTTDKPDKSSHGLGLKRIKQLAEKYGGGVEIFAENGVFSISVII